MRKSTFGQARGGICRTVIAATLIAAASMAMAETPRDKDASKGGAESKKHLSGPVDKETCIKEAAKMNMATIEFGKLAAQKAQNAELKKFGQTLEQDHRKAQSDLQAIASKHNVTIPTALEEECKNEIAKLQALIGEEFDREFAKGAVEGHAMALAHLQKANSDVKDADMKRYLGEMTSKLKEHQRRGRDIALAVGVDQQTITSLEKKAGEAIGSPAGTESETRKETKSNRASDQPK